MGRCVVLAWEDIERCSSSRCRGDKWEIGGDYGEIRGPRLGGHRAVLLLEPTDERERAAHVGVLAHAQRAYVLLLAQREQVVPVEHTVHQVGSAPRGRCTVWQCTVRGSGSYSWR